MRLNITAIRQLGILWCMATSVCYAQDQPTNGEEVVHLKEVYKKVDTTELTVDVFYTQKSMNTKGNTAIVFFHGGGWAFGEAAEFYAACKRYAKMGLITFSVTYRLSSENGKTPHSTITPIECVMDAKSAMRWVRGNADKYNIDPNKILASGQSAGGHLAISTFMIEEHNELSDNLSISAKPNGLLVFSASGNCVQPWCDYLLGDKRDQIWSISPAHNLKSGLPPAIHFHGTDDDIVPLWTVKFFIRDLEKLGNKYELREYEGRKHYLGDGNSKYARYFDDDILEEADDFLRRHSFL